MQDIKLSREDTILYYKNDVLKLLKYLPWLEKTSGGATSEIYSGEGIDKTSMAVPVYDTTLLSFIKEIKTTDFVNRNYVYTYSRYHMRTADDEKRIIDGCCIQDVKVLGDILSKYVIKGDVKGLIWSEGVQNGVYLAVLYRLKDLMEIH